MTPNSWFLYLYKESIKCLQYVLLSNAKYDYKEDFSL